MAGSENKKKDQAKAKKLRQKRRRPLTLDLTKSKKKNSAGPKTDQPKLRLVKPGGNNATSTEKPSPQQATPPAGPKEVDDPNIEHVHFYIRQHDRVEMDILVSNMRFKWGISQEQTWAAVKKLEAQRAVKIFYPNQDRSNATVSALWLE